MPKHPRHISIARLIHDITVSREALLFSTLFTALTLLWFSPARDLDLFQRLLASITQDRVVAEVNPHRATIGVNPLAVNPLLSQAAALKAQDMLARDYFSHYGPAGEPPWVWYKQVGYAYSAAGENLAIDFSDPSALVRAWLASPTHAANIQNGVFADIGIGIASGEFSGRETTIVVMFLGKPLTTSLATAAPAPSTDSTSSPQAGSGQAPAPTPAPATTPAPVASDATPVPEPPPVITPLTEPAPEPTLITQSEPMPPPIVTENVPPQEVFVTETYPENTAIATAIPLPASTTLLEFFLLKAALAMRWILSISFGTTIAASALLYAMPAHRVLVRLPGVGTLLLLAGLLWLPALL